MSIILEDRMGLPQLKTISGFVGIWNLSEVLNFAMMWGNANNVTVSPQSKDIRSGAWGCFVAMTVRINDEMVQRQYGLIKSATVEDYISTLIDDDLVIDSVKRSRKLTVGEDGRLSRRIDKENL